MRLQLVEHFSGCMAMIALISGLISFYILAFPVRPSLTPSSCLLFFVTPNLQFLIYDFNFHTVCV